MGSSKTISHFQVFWMVFLFQQSGVFWLLPYFLTCENGTAGLFTILAGVLAAIAILFVGQYWSSRVPDVGFVAALRQKHRIIGSFTGILFFLFYLLFSVIMLYSFVDVTEQQLLEETPGIVLCAVTVLLAGWMSQYGLESIARMQQLCIGALVVMLLISVLGTIDLFAIENALPFQIKNVTQLQGAAMHSIFCYSSLLMLFMIYPATGRGKSYYKAIFLAVGLGTVLTVLWTFYAMCILGEQSLQTILWIPVHLARMVQIRSLLEQTESLFVILWMMLSITGGSLLLWCASESLHQLFRKRKTWWLHWGMILAVCAGTVAVRNSMRLLQVETLLAYVMLVMLPVMLFLVLLLTPKRRQQQ